jgi:hypothetical protein
VTTTDWRDCSRLAKSLASVGGELPPALANLLRAHEVLSAPARADDPANAIIDACIDGSLTADKLAKMLPVAAAAAWAGEYRAGLARRSENILLSQFHQQLKAGAADQVIGSMRKQFDAHAEQIEHARGLINPESSLEHVLNTGSPELITAWQQLPGHLQLVSRIGAIAAQFGASPVAQFGQVTQYALADNHLISDAAIMATAGPLVTDSALFMRPDQGGRTSPWFRCGGLKLHTVEEARARYADFAAAEFDRIHGGPRGGYIGADHQVHEDPRPENPYRAKVPAT